MDGQLPGIAIATLCLALFAGAFRSSHLGKNRLALALVLAGGLALRLAAGGDQFLHRWDERYHALVAKNLIRHPLTPTLYADPVLPYDYRDWSANHVWVHKQPLPLWAMALSMKLFGVNEIALRLPSILLSTGAIALTCAIGTILFTPAAGFLAAFLHAINLLVIQVTAGRVATDHVDLFHLVFVELGVWVALLAARAGTRRRAALLGFVVGLAVLCKWLTALIVLPLWLLLRLGTAPPKAIARDLLIAAGVCCATFLPWQLYIHAAFPLEARWEGAYNLRHLTEALDGHGGPWTFFLRGLSHFGTLIALPIAWFLFRAARCWRESRWAVPAVWLLVPLVFFTLARTKMATYLLFTAPALFIMAAAFADTLSARWTPARFRTTLAAALLLVVAGPLFNLEEQYAALARVGETNERAVAVKSVARQVTDARAVFFNTPPIETMFYTSGTAYEELPTNRQVDELTARGYRVFVVDAGKLPAGFRETTQATLVRP